LIVIPAIDILYGKVVRTEHGLESKAKIYSLDPLETAESYFEFGAKKIHIVDLDSAIHGDSTKNKKIIEKILWKLRGRMKIQLAGGIRSLESAKEFITLGASSIVIGSLPYSNLQLAKSILTSLGADRVVLAIDYDKSGKVRTDGWLKQQEENILDAITRSYFDGFRQFLLTSIARDGIMRGPDFKTLELSKTIICKKTRFSHGKTKLIASGGISSRKDLSKLEMLHIDEAIVGRAFFEGRLDPSEIISVYCK
jgi:phosphoribosylformimino-5-aminoimidazole carboxamide ribotide isomerase